MAETHDLPDLMNRIQRRLDDPLAEQPKLADLGLLAEARDHLVKLTDETTPVADVAVAPVDRLCVPLAKAAEMLGVSERTTYDMARRGEIPTVRVRGRVVVPVAELRAWVVDHLENV
jgi:excisionase family DNA binding protein